MAIPNAAIQGMDKFWYDESQQHFITARTYAAPVDASYARLETEIHVYNDSGYCIKYFIVSRPVKEAYNLVEQCIFSRSYDALQIAAEN